MTDFRPIFFVVGVLLAVLSAAMLLPALVDLAGGSPDWLVFLLSALLTMFFAVSMMLATGQTAAQGMTVRQAFMLTTMAWVMLAGFAALPFTFADIDLSYEDALFEAMSGLTTTGATVIVGLDQISPGILLWRALLHWIGGAGIVVMGLAVLPALQVGGMQLFRTESSERMEKVLPRATSVASATIAIYCGLSLSAFLAYWVAGMAAFDALVHAMSAVATGGFSSHDTSIGFYGSAAIEWITVAFMIAGGITFTAYIQAVRGRPMVLWQDTQIRWFLAILASVTLLVALWRWGSGAAGLEEALRTAAFNVTSVATTTGFASEDYGAWGSFAFVVFFGLMFVGGCTGSTAGSVKVFRYVILFGALRKQMFGLLHPHGVYNPQFNGVAVPPNVASAVMGFFFLYGLTVIGVAAGLGLLGLDPVTALSGAAAAVGNVGPGLGEVIGPTGTYAGLPAAAKVLLSAAMLLGRLEMFTVLVILTPAFWRT